LLIPFPEWIESFEDFDRDLDAWRERFNRAIAIASDEQEVFSTTGVWTARRLIAFQAGNVAARLYNLGEGVTLALNKQNRHILAPIVRAMYEAAGITAYQHSHLLPLLRKGDRKGKDAKLMLFRLGLGADVGVGGEIRPYPVSSLIRALGIEVAASINEAEPGSDAEEMARAVRGLYSALTDHTHPNGAAMEGSFHRYTDKVGGFWKLDRTLTDLDIVSWFNGAQMLLEFVGPIWDAVMQAADEHPLVMPTDAEFGFEHFPPEALNTPAGSTSPSTDSNAP
jgi:hypothetical protein